MWGFDRPKNEPNGTNGTPTLSLSPSLPREMAQDYHVVVEVVQCCYSGTFQHIVTLHYWLSAASGSGGTSSSTGPLPLHYICHFFGLAGGGRGSPGIGISSAHLKAALAAVAASTAWAKVTIGRRAPGSQPGQMGPRQKIKTGGASCRCCCCSPLSLEFPPTKIWESSACNQLGAGGSYNNKQQRLLHSQTPSFSSRLPNSLSLMIPPASPVPWGNIGKRRESSSRTALWTCVCAVLVLCSM